MFEVNYYTVGRRIIMRNYFCYRNRPEVLHDAERDLFA